MMRWIGLLVLTFVLIVSLFGIQGAHLDNSLASVCLMILLICLFGDLKEFNFWGLVGRKEERDLSKVKDKDAIADLAVPKPKKAAVQTAERVESPKNLLDSTTDNFLFLAFEIERLLRVAGRVILEKEIGEEVSSDKLTAGLVERGFITEDGQEQLESVRWLRNQIVHGRGEEISEETKKVGLELAYSFYGELYSWLYE